MLLEAAETAVSDGRLLAFILQALMGLKWVLRQAHLLALHLQVLEPVDVASRGRGQRRRRQQVSCDLVIRSGGHSTEGRRLAGRHKSKTTIDLLSFFVVLDDVIILLLLLTSIVQRYNRCRCLSDVLIKLVLLLGASRCLGVRLRVLRGRERH